MLLKVKNFSVREYGFSKSDARATELDKLVPNELSGLPTNNLDTERDLSNLVFSLKLQSFKTIDSKQKA